MTPVRLALIGCGAVSELYYAPALDDLARTGRVDMAAIYDPDPVRVSVLAHRFPGAAVLSAFADTAQHRLEGAIVASPQRFHADQTVALLEQGTAVLCEKPMADTTIAAERMIAASERSGRPLLIGLFRRFFSATRAIRELVDAGTLGSPRSYTVAEGGRFNWPAASATFFTTHQSAGGVLHDLGVHVLDQVLHWLGEPDDIEYEDDAAGGLETNALIRMRHAGGLMGEIRLSRDWTTANRWHIAFERGWVGWRPGQANEFEIAVDGMRHACRAQVCYRGEHWGLPSAGGALPGYAQCFTEQVAHFARVVRGEVAPAVSGREGIRSLRLIERCCARRTAMEVV